jgi:hypothetical protein
VLSGYAVALQRHEWCDLRDPVHRVVGDHPHARGSGHARDDQVRAQGGQCLEVECLVVLACGPDRREIDVSDGAVRGAVVTSLRPEYPDGAYAVVPEDGGRADVRDDPLGALVELNVHAARVDEAPRRLGGPAGGRVIGAAGGQADQCAEGGGPGEQPAAADAGVDRRDHMNLPGTLVCLP